MGIDLQSDKLARIIPCFRTGKASRDSGNIINPDGDLDFSSVNKVEEGFPNARLVGIQVQVLGEDRLKNQDVPFLSTSE